MPGRPLVGASWMPGAAYRAAVEPVLGAVEALETTVDHTFAGVDRLPPSTVHVLRVYGDAGRLHGHGVNGSVFSAGREDRFERYLDGVRALPWTLVDFSEHVGYSNAGRYLAGPPLPVPSTEAVERVAVERLGRIREILGVPVGLENLALAFSRAQALEQGPFVAGILAAVDGFVHLDLHNLWCQLANFELDPETLLATWPLDRVRRLHVAGGRWEDGVRRDTHDHRVPDEVWALLERVLPRVPECRVVVLEQLPTALRTAEAQEGWRRDLARLHAVRDAAGPAVAEPWSHDRVVHRSGDRVALAAEQERAMHAFGDAASVDDLPADLAAGADPRMLEVARRLVGTWGSRDGAATGEEGG